MRTRSIKPDLWSNDAFGECSLGARILFLGLQCMADKEGRLEDRPNKIRALILPYDDIDSAAVCGLIETLVKAKLIQRYEVAGSHYLQILDWHKLQKIYHLEASSQIPAKPKETSGLKCPQGVLKANSKEHSPEFKSNSSSDSCFLTLDSCLLTPPSKPDGDDHQQKPEPSLDANTDGPPPGLLFLNGTAEPPQPSKAKVKQQQAEWFAMFWKEYWRKDAKKAAEKAFGKHVTTQAKFEQVMTGVIRQTLPMLTREPEHRPQAASWLNGERWNDEIAMAAAAGGRHASGRKTTLELLEAL